MIKALLVEIPDWQKQAVPPSGLTHCVLVLVHCFVVVG